jgi:hypothetical protein
MSKDAVVRQFFLDFLENLGDHVGEYQEHDEEERNQILADLFFDGRLEIKWNVENKKLMLKPTIVLDIEARALPETTVFDGFLRCAREEEENHCLDQAEL